MPLSFSPLTAVWRCRARLALGGLALAAGLAAAAAQAQTPAGAADPPGRVGKIGLIAGPVTLTDVRNTDPQPAVLNWPITTGHRLLTGPGGRAEVRIGSLALRLDGDTAVDFPRVDDEVVQIAVLRGTAALRVRNRELLGEYQLLTPRESIRFDDAGRYRIEVDRAAPGLTALTAFAGMARVETGRNRLTVPAGFRGEIGAEPHVSLQLVAALRDGFDDWVAAMDARDDTETSSRFVSRETTGIEVLDHYGSWRTVPEYGPVWFAVSVQPGWAPYRYGRWAFISPWGWTWIDDAPWGFATGHYGRWVLVGTVWGWVPGVVVPRPIYAPALVGWYGRPGGVSIGVSVGPLVGWFPLGPREVYVPPFHYSNRYWYAINRQHVPRIEQMPLPGPDARYIHQRPGAATWSRPETFTGSRWVQGEAVRAPDDLYRWPATALPAAELRPPAPGRILPAPGFSATGEPAAIPRPQRPVIDATAPIPMPKPAPGAPPVAPPLRQGGEMAPVPMPKPPAVLPAPGLPPPPAPPLRQGGELAPLPKPAAAPPAPGLPPPPALPPRQGGELAPAPMPRPPAAFPETGLPPAAPPPRQGGELAPMPMPKPAGPVIPVPPAQPGGMVLEPGRAMTPGGPGPRGIESPPPVRGEPLARPMPQPMAPPAAVVPPQPPPPPRPPAPPVRVEPLPKPVEFPAAPPRGSGGPAAAPPGVPGGRPDAVKGVAAPREERARGEPAGGPQR